MENIRFYVGDQDELGLDLGTLLGFVPAEPFPRPSRVSPRYQGIPQGLSGHLKTV